MLKTQGLAKIYRCGGNLLEVLKGVDLEVAKNEFLAIQGPSGAGKSTLLHLLGGLDYPSKGKVFFAGADIYSLNENERANFRNKKVGFVFQFYHLLPEFNALENVLLPGILKSWRERKKSLNYAKLLLEQLGLKERLGHKPNQLSGGEQQRVAIARALINQPQLLLCDEPTGNLDTQTGNEVISLIKKINRENQMAVVLVTHDNDIANSAHRIVHLKDGRLLN